MKVIITFKDTRFVPVREQDIRVQMNDDGRIEWVIDSKQIKEIHTCQ